MISQTETDTATKTKELKTVLVVDDSLMEHHLTGSLIKKMGGWQAQFASDGMEALEILKKGPLPSMVLADLMMPGMDGLELVQTIRQEYPILPVILMTAHGSEQNAIQALQNGAASYVPKGSLAKELANTMEQVLSVAQTNFKQQRILECLQRQEFHFTLDNDVSLVPILVQFLEKEMEVMKLCQPSRIIHLGVALHEALTNSILHGNLELQSTVKQQDEQLYYRMAAQRRQESPYGTRRVYVTAVLERDQATFTIRDEGPGFDPSQLPDPTDPSNLENITGRGLLLIHTFMDSVEHNQKGNQITMVKRRS